MSVFLIANVKVTDEAWLPDYAAKVHDIVARRIQGPFTELYLKCVARRRSDLNWKQGGQRHHARPP